MEQVETDGDSGSVTEEYTEGCAKTLCCHTAGSFETLKQLLCKVEELKQTFFDHSSY